VAQVERVVWPPSRMMAHSQIADNLNSQFIDESTGQIDKEKLNKFRESNPQSKVMKDQDVREKYGRPKYNDFEPDNSEIPGWTKGIGGI